MLDFVSGSSFQDVSCRSVETCICCVSTDCSGCQTKHNPRCYHREEQRWWNCSLVIQSEPPMLKPGCAETQTHLNSPDWFPTFILTVWRVCFPQVCLQHLTVDLGFNSTHLHVDEEIINQSEAAESSSSEQQTNTGQCFSSSKGNTEQEERNVDCCCHLQRIIIFSTSPASSCWEQQRSSYFNSITEISLCGRICRKSCAMNFMERQGVCLQRALHVVLNNTCVYLYLQNSICI